MTQLTPGLYPIEDEMPCSPGDIRIGNYLLPSTLERAEREEAAARILSFSKQLDSWVGVSWTRLAEMMQEDLETNQRVQGIQSRNWDAKHAHANAMRKYIVLSILTLGMYVFFFNKPTLQLEEVPELPFSLIFILGPESVVNGIYELLDDDMLKREQVGEADDKQDIFFPTTSLIGRIMEVQHVL